MTPKPCPFCGNEPEPKAYLVNAIRYAIWCSMCEYWGPKGRSENLAIEAWNTRAGSEYQAEIDALKAELKQLKGGK